MGSWLSAFHQGRRHLACNNPDDAVRCFKAAMSRCPECRKTELAIVLFYFTGLTVEKLDDFSRRERSAEGDDWQLFYDVQLERYLRSKKTQALGTLAERDMIRDLIDDAWRELPGKEALAGLSREEKKERFRDVHIVFPFFILKDGNRHGPVRRL